MSNLENLLTFITISILIIFYLLLFYLLPKSAVSRNTGFKVITVLLISLQLYPLPVESIFIISPQICIGYLIAIIYSFKEFKKLGIENEVAILKWIFAYLLIFFTYLFLSIDLIFQNNFIIFNAFWDLSYYLNYVFIFLILIDVIVYIYKKIKIR